MVEFASGAAAGPGGCASACGQSGVRAAVAATAAVRVVAEGAPGMAGTSDLYDEDILQWSEQQAALLRRGAAGELVNDAELDWPNIAEEIESVGRSELHGLESHLILALLHDLRPRLGRDRGTCRTGGPRRGGPVPTRAGLSSPPCGRKSTRRISIGTPRVECRTRWRPSPAAGATNLSGGPPWASGEPVRTTSSEQRGPCRGR